MFREHGVMWQDAEKLARGEVDAFVEVDPWTAGIAAWLRRVAQPNLRRSAMLALCGLLAVMCT